MSSLVLARRQQCFSEINCYSTLTASTPASTPQPTSTTSGSTIAALESPATQFPGTTSSNTAPASSSMSSASTQSASRSSTTTPTRSTVVAATTSKPNAGTIAGGVVGGVVFLVLVLLGILLYLRARKRKRTPPSSEFINSLRDGAPPVLRLDPGAEYNPALPEKGGYTHYPPATPLPLQQNSYYTSAPVQDMKFPDEMMMTDIPSRRPSVEKPLHPQRYSLQPTPKDAFVSQSPHLAGSVGSKGELLGSGVEMVSREASPASKDSVLHFAPRFSLDDSFAHPPHSFPPTSLQPLRRQPDS